MLPKLSAEQAKDLLHEVEREVARWVSEPGAVEVILGYDLEDYDNIRKIIIREVNFYVYYEDSTAYIQFSAFNGKEEDELSVLDTIHSVVFLEDKIEITTTSNFRCLIRRCLL